ncbi:MAG: transcriptional repressor LexA [Alphaproteobacteria bacterium]|nr:transcriptional repressor LexA [Alphaproteobacteria bacterium]
MLTRKQHELLVYINKCLGQRGVSPSFDEMKEALNLRSKSGIHRLITGLEERGFIRRLPHRARALEVLRLPDDVALADQGNGRRGFAPQVINGGLAIPAVGTRAKAAGDTEAVELPLLGKIAAGTPIEALRDPTRSQAVPAGMLGRGEYYCLEVEGDSMIEAGIHDGDTVIVERCDTAENGAIVVALIEGEEVTLKRLRRRNNSVALEPANPRYETRIFGPDQVELQGRLVGLIRQY